MSGVTLSFKIIKKTYNPISASIRVPAFEEGGDRQHFRRSDHALAAASVDPNLEHGAILGAGCPADFDLRQRRPALCENGGMATAKNVLGGELMACSFAPLTGFFRDGSCDTRGEEGVAHLVCVRVTEAFLTVATWSGRIPRSNTSST